MVGRFAEGLPRATPTPNGITLLTRIDGRGAAGGVELEVARDKGFKNVVTRKPIRTRRRARPLVKARVTGLKPYEQYYYRFATKRPRCAVGPLPDRAAGGLAPAADVRLLLLPGLHARLLQRARVMAREDLDFVVCLGDYIYAETYHSLAGGTAVRDDTIGSPGYPARRHARGRLARRLPRQVLALPPDTSLRKLHAKSPMIVDLGRPRGPGQLRRRRPRTAACRPSRRYIDRPARRGLSGLLRVHADLRRQARPDLPQRCASARRSTCSCSTSASYRADQPCGDAVAPACADSTSRALPRQRRR